MVDALDDLSKSSRINNSHNFIPIPKLLPMLYLVITILIRYRELIPPPEIANGVYFIVNSQFNLFKLSQVPFEYFQSFLATEAIVDVTSRSLLSYRCTLTAGCLCLLRDVASSFEIGRLLLVTVVVISWIFDLFFIPKYKTFEKAEKAYFFFLWSLICVFCLLWQLELVVSLVESSVVALVSLLELV
jgi:hypothetical protein